MAEESITEKIDRIYQDLLPKFEGMVICSPSGFCDNGLYAWMEGYEEYATKYRENTK